MQFSVLTLLLSLTAAVTAIDYSAVPPCSLLCFMQAINASGCAIDDTKCQCTTGLAKITESVTPCVLQSCSADDAAKVSAGTQQICAAYTSVSVSSVINSAASAATAGSASATSATAVSGTKSTATASATVAQATTNAASMLKPFGGAVVIGGLMGAMVL